MDKEKLNKREKKTCLNCAKINLFDHYKTSFSVFYLQILFKTNIYKCFKKGDQAIVFGYILMITSDD